MKAIQELIYFVELMTHNLLYKWSIPCSYFLTCHIWSTLEGYSKHTHNKVWEHSKLCEQWKKNIATIVAILFDYFKNKKANIKFCWQHFVKIKMVVNCFPHRANPIILQQNASLSCSKIHSILVTLYKFLVTKLMFTLSRARSVFLILRTLSIDTGRLDHIFLSFNHFDFKDLEKMNYLPNLKP